MPLVAQKARVILDFILHVVVDVGVDEDLAVFSQFSGLVVTNAGERGGQNLRNRLCDGGSDRLTYEWFGAWRGKRNQGATR